MIGIRRENYKNGFGELPFLLYPHLERTPLTCSREQNWHDNPELQLCLDGEGTVLLNGVEYPFIKHDIVLVNANDIHYTRTESKLTYLCLIVDTELCVRNGLDHHAVSFTPRIRDERLSSLLHRLADVCESKDDGLRVARATSLALQILVVLFEDYAQKREDTQGGDKHFAAVKQAVVYLQEHYAEHIRLDEVARAVLTDKYALCRHFKQLMGVTLFSYLHQYRCVRATELLLSGRSVGDAAAACGFDNLSFFTKTFKRYTGRLPSEVKTRDLAHLR